MFVSIYVTTPQGSNKYSIGFSAILKTICLSVWDSLSQRLNRLLSRCPEFMFQGKIIVEVLAAGWLRFGNPDLGYPLARV
jgi:hypothetical protein